MYFFLQTSKEIDYGTNRKRACDFVLVCHSNFGPILHISEILPVLCSWPYPYSTLILGCSRWTRSLMSAGAETLSYSAVKLFSMYSNLCEKHTRTSQRDRQADGRGYRRMTYCGISLIEPRPHLRLQSVTCLRIR